MNGQEFQKSGTFNIYYGNSKPLLESKIFENSEEKNPLIRCEASKNSVAVAAYIELQYLNYKNIIYVKSLGLLCS